MKNEKPTGIDDILDFVEKKIYKTCGLVISDLQLEPEGKIYHACHFKLNDKKVYSRLSKITPKKNGQFVTFWKRNKEAITEPFSERDNFYFLIINVKFENRFGQFVFPKSILLKKGIITTSKKEGKRGFRVYPIWDIAVNKQATKTQKWQLDYFLELNQTPDFKQLKALYLTT